MSTIELELDEKTLGQVKDIAARRRATVEALIEDLVRRLIEAESDADPLLGMFSQEPQLLDAAVDSTMQARENDPLRLAAA